MRHREWKGCRAEAGMSEPPPLLCPPGLWFASLYCISAVQELDDVAFLTIFSLTSTRRVVLNLLTLLESTALSFSSVIYGSMSE